MAENISCYCYFLSPEETFPAQVGAIYSLYLLYFTQPTVFRKVPVRLTITAWQNLELLYQIAFEYDATDLIYVIHKLRDRGAFLYVAQNDRISKELRDENADLLDRTERTLVRMEKKINASPLVPVDTLLSDLSKMAAMYHEAKADLVSLSLARRSSEMVMAHLSKLKPPDLNIREATPLPAFLKDKMIAREAPSGISARSAATIATTADDSSLRSANKNVARIPEPLPDRPLIMFEQLPPTSEDATFSSSDTRPDPNQNFTSVLATEPPVSESTASIGSPNQNYRNPDYDDIAPRASPSKKRHAKRPVTLPNVFSYSMLQASRADFPQKIENISRNYIRDRIARFEFAATGGLPRNEYRFPETPLMVKRRKPLEIDQEDPEEKERLRMEQLEEKKARAKERQRGREQRKRDLDKMKTEEERARDQSEQDPEGACMEERAQGQAGTDREQGSRGQAAESAEQVREDGEQGAQGVQGQSAASTDQARQETIGNHDYNGLERQDNGSMES
ncbi:hypothetical protein BGZ58_006239 [Dissophora ornata]|nr:hypothetical protein BGZ58_006239 [Dissophora ornata]